jgi:RHS repeat-associated protein
MVTTITNTSTNAALPQATLYGYDQLNRLITTKAWANLNTTTNVWGNNTYTGLYQNDFTYDANGNIVTQLRKNDAGTTIDNLTYSYYNSSGKILKNRLYHVDDAVTSGTFTDDVDDMGTFNNGTSTYNTSNNYIYDAEGRLTQDLQEQIQTILWRVDGKVAEIQRTAGSTRKNLKFDYDAMGQRIAKHQYAGNVWEKSTYYVRDAQGNVLATYEKVNPGTASMVVKERDIYGSSRIGMYTKQVQMIGATNPGTSSYQHETGSRQYELTNHLGNVLAVITDRKRPLDLGDYDFSGDGNNDSNSPQSGTPDNRVDFYRAELIASTDYSPFGVDLVNRSFTSSSYRYGFQGQEKDNEIKPGTGSSDGNSVNFTYRMHDPRLGRFFAVDPLIKKYPHYSSYSFSGNKVIAHVELEGLEDVYNMLVEAQEERRNAALKPGKGVAFTDTWLGKVLVYLGDDKNWQGKGEHGTKGGITFTNSNGNAGKANNDRTGKPSGEGGSDLALFGASKAAQTGVHGWSNIGEKTEHLAEAFKSGYEAYEETEKFFEEDESENELSEDKINKNKDKQQTVKQTVQAPEPTSYQDVTGGDKKMYRRAIYKDGTIQYEKTPNAVTGKYGENMKTSQKSTKQEFDKARAEFFKKNGVKENTTEIKSE